jgi:hypothetical protein
MLPDWPEAHITLARVQLNFGEPMLALHSYQAAARLQPQHPDLVRGPTHSTTMHTLCDKAVRQHCMSGIRHAMVVVCLLRRAAFTISCGTAGMSCMHAFTQGGHHAHMAVAAGITECKGHSLLTSSNKHTDASNPSQPPVCTQSTHTRSPTHHTCQVASAAACLPQSARKLLDLFVLIIGS